MRRWLILNSNKEYELEIGPVMPPNMICELPEFVSREMLPYISVKEEGGKLVPVIDQDGFSKKRADDRDLLFQLDGERRKVLADAVKQIEAKRSYNAKSPIGRAYHNLFGGLGEKVLLFLVTQLGKKFSKE